VVLKGYLGKKKKDYLIVQEMVIIVGPGEGKIVFSP
jgi:hypothetical protein